MTNEHVVFRFTSYVTKTNKKKKQKRKGKNKLNKC